MRARLVLTTRAKAYALAAIVLLLLGSLMQSLWASISGGILWTWLLAETAFTMGRPPGLRLDLASSRVHEGDRVAAVVSVSGGRRSHEVEVVLPPFVALASGTNIFPGNESRHEMVITCDVRGPQGIGPFRVRSWSPARLVGRETSIGEGATLEVIPRPMLPDGIDLGSRVLKPSSGRFLANRPGQGFEFFSLRDYVSGDTMRSVNWKASAKSEDLIVNQRQRETQTELLFLLDARLVSMAGPPGRTPLDQGCRALLALVEDAQKSRDVVRLFRYGDGVQQVPWSGQDRFMTLENALAGLQGAGSKGLAEAWQQAKASLRSRGPIVVLSSLEADPEAPSAIRSMTALGHPVLVVSPAPTGQAWDGNLDRNKERAVLLSETRANGATALDWLHKGGVQASA